jgi:hypothetical protein
MSAAMPTVPATPTATHHRSIRLNEGEASVTGEALATFADRLVTRAAFFFTPLDRDGLSAFFRRTDSLLKESL